MRIALVSVGSGVLIAMLNACNAADFRSESASESKTTQDGDENSDQSNQDDQVGTDAPEWVNGSYLTCQLINLTTDNNADVSCKFDPSAVTSVKDFSCSWDIENASAKTKTSSEAGADCEYQFVIPNATLSTAMIKFAVTVSDAKKVITKSLMDSLVLLEKNSLISCLQQQDPVKCLFGGTGGSVSAVPPWGASNPVPSGGNMIFKSSRTYTGNLGGLAGADAECQELAVAAGLPGTWKAMLSDATESARSRISFMTFLRNGSKNINVVALSSFSLWMSGRINSTIILDERDQPASGDVWTGSSQAGVALAGGNCNNWSSDSAELVGGVGRGEDLAQWLQHSDAACSEQRHLYCIDQ